MTNTVASWLAEQIDTDTDECVLWPFSTAGGYGQLRYRGRVRKAHRVAWELSGRALPAAPLVLRHRCNQPLCVNVRHLTSGTAQANTRDRLGYSVKLTPEAIHAIRTNPHGELQRVLAERYGVDQSTISNIQTGKRWAHVLLPAGTAPARPSSLRCDPSAG